MTKTAVGCFIFAGGFTLGVKRAGFEVLAQLEDGPYGVATTRRNHPGLAVHVDPERWPLEELAGKVDFVYGNPPCAPFSNAGVSHKKVGLMGDWWRADPRVQCVHKMFRALEIVRPKVWAWESVQPALQRGRPLVDELTAVAATHGYAASYVLENGVHLGTPQVRRRVFMIFHTVAIDWMYPRPGMHVTEWTGSDTFASSPSPRTVRDAWVPISAGAVIDQELAGSDLPPRYLVRDSAYMDVLDRTPQGGSLRKLWEKEHPEETWDRTAHGTVRGRPRFLDSRLAYDRPAPTLTGGETKFHPEKRRYVSLLEQQLLCGYPADYEFVGATAANRRAQTAQAVMPPVGEWLGRNVMRALEANVPAEPGARIVDLEAAWGSTAPARAARPKATRTEKVMEGVIDAATSVPVNVRPTWEPARPAQASTLPVWEEYSGPTALARVLIAEGHDDGPILAATAAAIRGAKVVAAQVAGKPWPHLFTKTDLARLRARLVRDAQFQKGEMNAA